MKVTDEKLEETRKVFDEGWAAKGYAFHYETARDSALRAVLAALPDPEERERGLVEKACGPVGILPGESGLFETRDEQDACNALLETRKTQMLAALTPKPKPKPLEERVTVVRLPEGYFRFCVCLDGASVKNETNEQDAQRYRLGLIKEMEMRQKEGK